MCEDKDLNKKQAATTTEGLMRMLTYNVKILKGKMFLSRHTSVLDFKSSTGTRASPPVLSDVGDHDPDDMLTVQVEVPHPLSFHLFVISYFSVNFSYVHLFSWSK